jgi:carboxypeptidase C (cathepsin A)
MKNLFTLCALSIAALSMAQRSLPSDTLSIKNDRIRVGSEWLDYSVEVGTQPVWDTDGSEIAYLQYTYYKRSGVNSETRPLIMSFNGGPGSGSVWMHLAYTGPKVLRVDDEGYPIQPYGVKDNPNTVLTDADIVYINPVNTGYSRTIPLSGKEVDRKKFFGIDADITYLAEWLNTFVTRHNKWRAPKYIIGESYGGTRVMGLALTLQESQWMYLNGVIMVSPADYQVLRVGGPVSEALNVPYYSAAAWYHNQLSSELQQLSLENLLEITEAFTVDTLLPALAKGGSLSPGNRDQIASDMARYTGLSKSDILALNLSVPTGYFWKNLLKDEGYTVGRLDSRYKGVDKVGVGTRPEYNSELTSWLHSFTPAINYYYNEVLGFRTDVKYNMFGPVRPWEDDRVNTREDLRAAMAENPYLHVLNQSGYFDGATTYFNAKYTLWQIDPSGKFNDRLQFKGYESGHMMYLRAEDLKAANEDLKSFIQQTQTKGNPAKY